MNKHKQFSFDLLSVFPVSLFVHNISIDHLSFRDLGKRAKQFSPF